jgi:hypothetical protein
MKLKSLLCIVALAMGLSLLVACQKGASDAQLTGQVKSNLSSDATVAARSIDVQLQNGVVTLSGTVQSEAERASAAQDAARVSGVKTVINNLQVQPQTAEAIPPAKQATTPAPERSARAVRGHRSTARAREETPRDTVTTTQNPAAQSAAPPSAPAEPARPATVTIPDGADIPIRLADTLDSATAQPGQTFHGTLAQPITVGDQVVLPVGADVEGRVVEAQNAAHFKGASSLTLQLTRLSVNGKSYELQTDQWSKQGTARGKNTAEKVGGGAALGAIIGGIAGGGKGAAIGGAIGAGAGTGVQAATRGQQVHLDPEAVLNFRLTQPLTVTPAAHRIRE